MSRLQPGAVVDYYVKRGLSPDFAAALAGNFSQESGLKPTAVNPDSGAYGLGQWLGPRKQGLVELANARGSSPEDPNIQLDFALHELNTSENRAAQKVLSQPTLDGKTAAIGNHFERAGQNEMAMDNRIAYAKTALADWFKHFAKGVANTIMPAAEAAPAPPSAPKGNGLPPGTDLVPAAQYWEQQVKAAPAPASPPALPPQQPAASQPPPPGVPAGADLVPSLQYYAEMGVGKGPSGGASALQGLTSELQNAWAGLKQSAANRQAQLLQDAGNIAQGIPESAVGKEATAQAQQQAQQANAETSQFLSGQAKKNQPYTEAHPYLFSAGKLAGSLLESLPMMLAMPQLPAVSLTKGIGTALSSLGGRAAADALLGAGTGAAMTPLQPQAVSSPDEYRQALANVLQGNATSGAIAGPLADVLASGLIGAIRGGGKMIGGFTNKIFGTPGAGMSPEAMQAIKDYDLYAGAGDIQGAPILTRAENLLATNAPITGIPDIYAAGVESAQKAADSLRGGSSQQAGLTVAEDIAKQRADRLAAQRGAAEAIATPYAPPTGMSADQGIKAGVVEQLNANKADIRKAYDQVSTLIGQKGLTNTPIPLPETQTAVTELLDNMPKSTRDLAPPALVRKLENVRDMTAGQGLTFNEVQDLDRRLGDFYGQARRASGGVGSEMERAYGMTRSALGTDVGAWASSTGNQDVLDVLNAAKQTHIEKKLPYTKAQNPDINKVIYEGQPEGAYQRLFSPKTPEESANNFSLLSQNGQKSAKYGFFSNILRAAEKGGEFDREAFLKAARDQAPLAQKILSPTEQKAFGDVVESIEANVGEPLKEQLAGQAIQSADPTALMHTLMQNDVRVRTSMSKLSPHGQDAMADYVVDKAYTTAVDPVTGDFSLGKFATGIAKNAEVLKQAGRWDEMKGLVEVFKETQRISASNLKADPPTGQRVISAAGMGAAFFHPLGAMAAVGAGRVLSSLLTSPTGKGILASLGNMSASAAQASLESPVWQKNLVKALIVGTTAGRSNR